jgi:para-aminobenzoate synthetase/4-amino-4-deoxychorismate lyase
MDVEPGTRRAWFPLPRGWRAYAMKTAGCVLLETAGGLGEDHTSYLFRSPERVLLAGSAAQVEELLAEIDAAQAGGLYAAGRLDYEAGYGLQGLAAREGCGALACFGVYREALRFDHLSGETSGGELELVEAEREIAAQAYLSEPRLALGPEAYAEKFRAVQEFLLAGDTYQANLTMRVEARLLGPALDLYEALIEQQPVDFAAIVNLDERLVLSFSPEMFFRVSDGRRISTRPMKGTAPRGESAVADDRQREFLAGDEKNRAEHVMIVDLLRNDLGRVCVAGTVKAEKLFCVEEYPTLFQMTSTVGGTLRAEVKASGVLRALFPSGSVTGAPKRRTMDILRGLEDEPRGVYTGAIGFVGPEGRACFSVPIRTLEVEGADVRMGVGGGVVADSTAEGEYAECLLKASFLKAAVDAPRLIETLRWEGGFEDVERHLARLAGSAAELGMRCDGEEVRAQLMRYAERFGGEARRVRLLLAADGRVEIEDAAIVGPTENLRVRIAARRVDSGNLWQRHKTTRRAFYERELASVRAAGFDEVLFLNERGELAEGAISSVFVELDGRMVTPPLSAGILPGVFRERLLETRPEVEERVLRMEDLRLADLAYLGNALRGLRSIESLHVE